MKLVRLLRAANTARLATTLLALWKLIKHPATPPVPKWVALAVLAYAVSPIDLIPDFIPVLGLLDDLVLVPLGIALVVRLTPRAVWEQCQREAQIGVDSLPRWKWGAVVVVLVWLVMLGGMVWWLLHMMWAT